MIIVIRWIRLLLSYCLLMVFIFCALNYKMAVYLCYQAKGQLHILFNREDINQFVKRNNLSKHEKENILLIEKVKKFSVDSLDYKSTNNFTQIYNQKNATALWVITASEPYALKAYMWKFPLIGKVSYKGFFKKDLAEKEFYRLKSQGFDVDMRTVSAWSTLGWLDDPILSNMLNRSSGSLCNLLFHELFHATYYAPDAVNFNENIANFIAHKATIGFLQKDTAHLNEYLRNNKDNLCFNNFMVRQNTGLKHFYTEINRAPDKLILKLKALNHISDSIKYLSEINLNRTEWRRKQILESKNAYFIDFEQYESMQDSLESIFNKIYKGNLKRLVQDLRENKSIIKFDN